VPPANYEVVEESVATRPTAVVAAATSWQEFPRLWMALLDEVWACLRANGIHSGCRNVMLYLDDLPHVEVGVELTQPCRLTGRVVSSSLPAATVAKAVHWGTYDGLGGVHDAVKAWCRARDRPRAGPWWEVYGPHRDDPAEVWTEVYYVLR
jgi:effector-binding domain-containing protein